jgi:hypothetical protein
MPYTVYEHVHRFAAWAASTAARSSKASRFSVETGKAILEESGFDAAFLAATLPAPDEMEGRHREWRAAVIAAARNYGKQFSHGISAKLINVYLKSAYVVIGRQNEGSVAALHPPFDRLLLDGLKEADPDRRRAWTTLKNKGWSRWTSDDYETAVRFAKEERAGEPLWTIEEHWRGYQ